MTKSKAISSMSLILAMLVAANTMLSYSAVCVFFDIDLFPRDGLGLDNFLSIVVACGAALVLLALPRTAALNRASGSTGMAAACMIGCLLVAAADAGLRAAADASSTTIGVDGTVTTSIGTAGLFFGALMLVLSLGESAVSYLVKIDELKRRIVELKAARVRMVHALEDIEAKANAACSMAQSRCAEARAECSAASERAMQSLVALSGSYQNSFIGYADALGQVRTALDDELEAATPNFTAPDGEPSWSQSHQNQAATVVQFDELPTPATYVVTAE